MNTLEIAEVGKAFGSNQVLSNVSLSVAPGEIVALVGPSGSGKSTLLSILTGSLAADSGEVRYGGKPVAGTTQHPFAFMPQRDALLPWRRIVDNATIGLEVAGVRRARARQQVKALLEPFGLAGTEELYPSQLSGGMRQRVSFLRTVVQNKPVLLLDEPFGALDAITRDDLQRWLLEMWAQHAWTILFITHDIREAVRLADRVLVMPEQAGSLLGNVQVSREIPRISGFLKDPRVPELEEHLHELLRCSKNAQEGVTVD